MSSSQPFPPYQPNQPILARAELINYLLRLRAEGHDVYTNGDGYVIQLPKGPLGIYPVAELWRVGFTIRGISSTYGDVRTLQELDDSLSQAAYAAGVTWPFRPNTGRYSIDN